MTGPRGDDLAKRSRTAYATHSSRPYGYGDEDSVPRDAAVGRRRAE